MGLALTENNVFALPEECLFVKSRPIFGLAPRLYYFFRAQLN